MALALVGGGYHEAFHTLYSCRRDVTVDEACAVILPRWAMVPNWSVFYKLLQEWSNIVEDIRIVRVLDSGLPAALSYGLRRVVTDQGGLKRYL